MLNQVNSSLIQYGISTSVLKKSDTDKLINQAIDQVYAGEKINLDLSPIVNNVGTSVNSQLAQYGLSTSMLPAGSSSAIRSEEHTSELQSRFDLVCRLLLEKKNSSLSRVRIFQLYQF